MEDTILQRVNKVLDNKGVSITYLSKELGVVQTTLNRQIKGDVQLSSATIEAFLHFFQDVSSEWLLRGNGSMLKSESSDFSFSYEGGTPLLPIEAWGGSLSGSSISILAEQCKKYNVPINNIDFLIPIAGDSMMPDYCPGDIVGIKKINERAFIEWGKVYVLDTCNGVVIKEIQPSENEGYITCVSRNMPGKYKPFEVSLNPDDFYGMYTVKGTVRLS